MIAPRRIAHFVPIRFWPVLALGVATSVWGAPHEHGAVHLDVAVEAGQLSIQADIPLDNLLGFERAPRNPAERQAADAALATLKDGAKLFITPAAAGCAFTSANVEAPVLTNPKPPAGEHAEAEAQYVFTCATPAQLSHVDVALLAAFKRIKRADVQVVAPKGQSKAVLKPGKIRVPLIPLGIR